MLAAALVLVVAAVLLWPGRGGPSAAEPKGPAEGNVEADGVDATGARRASARPTVDEAADALVLCALALRSGLGPVESLEAVADRVPEAVARQLRIVASAHRWGQDAATSWGHVGDGWQSASLAWQAAEQSGAAPAGVVLAAAQRMRREEASRVETAVQRAGVLLVLPLGVCFLPGFVGTTVVPVVLHLAGVSLGSG
ncbi:type II secretion system F family protein [Knoellia sp. LjRoot47]|uniref:type II secretion system F family protein n=1 Tax=Knoellia sp. LjRoot47 TaxID=3342330 RepID=UPI003ECF1E3C